jgi:pyruvate dehydrogenase E2 component (dihydrolipoamide acetyltransferase)
LSAGGAKGEVRVEEPSAAERTVARRAAEARATVPELELAVDADAGACLELQAQRGASITAILARACALSLREHPRANGSYRDGHFELYSRVNVGIVVAAEDTYLIPTVFDADEKPLAALSEEIEELIAGASEGRLSSSAYSGATFTIWDAGVHGVRSASIPAVPPQSAAIAAGAIRKVPALRAGELVAGTAMTVTLTCDHRILYGARAAAFLAAVKSRLEQAAG